MIEHTILSNLVYNRDYSTTVSPHLKEDYFTEQHNQIIYRMISKYIDQYGKLPSREALLIELDRMDNISDAVNDRAVNAIKSLSVEETNTEYLIKATEDYVRQSAYNNALRECILLQSKGQEGKGPSIMQEALAISFDTNIGHDYVADKDKRFEYYHKKENKIPIIVPSVLGIVTKGGFSRKTLNVFVAGTHVGKSLFMCHLAADNILSGQNVLYITLEMAEEQIALRIDTNLLNLTFDELDGLSKEQYDKRFARLVPKIAGRLKIVEYPNGTANTNHFKALLKDLKQKEGFVPDIIYIDYLNLMASVSFKDKSQTYGMVKAISEEVRSLAQSEDLAIVSASQLTRSGASSADPDMTQTSESWALPQTVDFLAILYTNDELNALNQMVMKLEKNRYGGVVNNKRTLLGSDRLRQKIYDLEDFASRDIEPYENEPMFDHDEKTGMIKLKEDSGPGLF